MSPAAEAKPILRPELGSHSFLFCLRDAVGRHPSLPIPTTHEAGSTPLPVQPENRDFAKLFFERGFPPFISVQRPCTVNTDRRIVCSFHHGFNRRFLKIAHVFAQPHVPNHAVWNCFEKQLHI